MTIQTLRAGLTRMGEFLGAVASGIRNSILNRIGRADAANISPRVENLHNGSMRNSSPSSSLFQVNDRGDRVIHNPVFDDGFEEGDENPYALINDDDVSPYAVVVVPADHEYANPQEVRSAAEYSQPQDAGTVRATPAGYEFPFARVSGFVSEENLAESTDDGYAPLQPRNNGYDSVGGNPRAAVVTPPHRNQYDAVGSSSAQISSNVNFDEAGYAQPSVVLSQQRESREAKLRDLGYSIPIPKNQRSVAASVLVVPPTYRLPTESYVSLDVLRSSSPTSNDSAIESRGETSPTVESENNKPPVLVLSDAAVVESSTDEPALHASVVAEQSSSSVVEKLVQDFEAGTVQSPVTRVAADIVKPAEFNRIKTQWSSMKDTTTISQKNSAEPVANVVPSGRVKQLRDSFIRATAATSFKRTE